MDHAGLTLSPEPKQTTTFRPPHTVISFRPDYKEQTEKLTP